MDGADRRTDEQRGSEFQGSELGCVEGADRNACFFVTSYTILVRMQSGFP